MKKPKGSKKRLRLDGLRLKRDGETFRAGLETGSKQRGGGNATLPGRRWVRAARRASASQEEKLQRKGGRADRRKRLHRRRGGRIAAKSSREGDWRRDAGGSGVLPAVGLQVPLPRRRRRRRRVRCGSGGRVPAVRKRQGGRHWSVLAEGECPGGREHTQPHGPTVAPAASTFPSTVFSREGESAPSRKDPPSPHWAPASLLWSFQRDIDLELGLDQPSGAASVGESMVFSARHRPRARPGPALRRVSGRSRARASCARGWCG